MARTFSDPQAWVSEGEQEVENFSKTGYFLTFECDKKQFSALFAFLFLHTSIWVSEGGQEFENFTKRCCFLNFEG